MPWLTEANIKAFLGQDESAWADFQRQHTRDCAVGAVRADGIIFLLAICELTFLLTADGFVLHSAQDKAVGTVMLACTVVMFGFLSYIRKVGLKSSNGSLMELTCCIAHNGLKMTLFFALFCWRIVHIPNDIMMHKAYLSAFLITLACSIHYYYVPLQWHIAFVSVPAGISWISFHWAADFLTSTSASWAVLWPCIGLFFYRHIQAREWGRFQSFRKNEEMRALSEAWEVALRSILSSVFDATCECDKSGKVLSSSPHFLDLMGRQDDSTLGSLLSELAANPSESARVDSFLEYISTQGLRQGGTSPAAKLETSFSHQSSGHEVRLSLYCVLLPLKADKLAETSRLLIGWQRGQCEGDIAASTCGTCYLDQPSEAIVPLDAPRLPMDFVDEDRSMVGAQDLPTLGERCTNDALLDEASRVKFDFETSSSLSYTLTNPVSCPSMPILERKFASTQTDCSLQSILSITSCEKSIQTETPPRPRPPRPPNPSNKSGSGQMTNVRSSVNFRESQRLYRSFKTTPQQTIEVLLLDVAEKINPSGRSCCGWHMSLASCQYVLNYLRNGKCGPRELEMGAVWQCQNCFTMNCEDSPVDKQADCSTCGEAQVSISGSSYLADASDDDCREALAPNKEDH